MVSNLNGQWSSDIILSNPNDGVHTTLNNAHSVATDGNLIHTICYELPDWYLIYKRSTNSGITWSSDIRLTFSSGQAINPTIAADGNNVHVAWSDNRTGNFLMYYKRSSNGGITWSADIQLTFQFSSYDASYPCISALRNTVQIVWQDKLTGFYSIYHKRSTDGGASWSSVIRIAENSDTSKFPSVASFNNIVHVVWQSNNGIYYKNSFDNGSSWTNSTQTISGLGLSTFPCIAVSDTNVHIVWQDMRDGNNEIYYRHSINNGMTWIDASRLTVNSAISKTPTIAASGSAIHVTWEDNRVINPEIYYKNSTDNGVSWSSDFQITNTVYNSNLPSLCISGSNLHLVWQDVSSNSFGSVVSLFYKRNPTGNYSIPSTPSNLVATSLSSSEIKLNWNDNSNNEIGFKIQRSSNGGTNWEVIDSVLQNVNTYTNLGLTNNTKYNYRIFSYSNAGNSAYSNISSSTTQMIAPPAPTLISPPNNSLGTPLTPLLDWDTVMTAASYKIQVSNDSLFINTIWAAANILQTQTMVPTGVLTNNTKYYWRVWGVNLVGPGSYSTVWNFKTTLVKIVQDEQKLIKVRFSQNYPNPFNPTTNIEFSIPEKSFVKLNVFDISGKQVSQLVNENLSAGTFKYDFNAENLPSGIYFYKFETDKFSETKKMILIK